MTSHAARHTVEHGRKRPSRSFTACVTCALAMSAVIGFPAHRSAQAADGDPPPLPEFADVKRAVEQHFAALADHRPGDLILRGQIGPLFARLDTLGWKVDDRATIEERLVAEQSFLGKSLSTTAGRKFMRQVATYPDAFDRLERLAKLPQGEQTIRALIRGPDGYKMIKYMTTSPGGTELGRMLSNTPRGKGFNEPTERIYTADDLLACLKTSLEAARAAADTN